MTYRYRLMIYKPDHYHFHTDDRTEWFPVGIFNYNVSRMIKELKEYDDSPESSKRKFLPGTVIKKEISVAEAIDLNFGLGDFPEEHIEKADLTRPLIFVEVSPDRFSMIDGNHRLAKAQKHGIDMLSAYFIYSHEAARYLSSEEEYRKYVEYWNSKVKAYGGDPAYRGSFCPLPSPQKERDLDSSRIWEHMLSQLDECSRVELYSEGLWFTLFAQDGKVFCREAEFHSPSIKFSLSFIITQKVIDKAVQYFEDWEHSDTWDKHDRKERRKEIRRKIQRADVIMGCVRVFSEADG